MARTLLCLALIAAIVIQTFGFISVDPETKFFVDEHGRTRIFHGVNAVYKVHPYHPIVDSFDPQNSLCPEDIQNLYDWGFNFVRLGMMWPGVETARFVYNQTYIETMQQLVKNLAAKDIYTLLDCHQDLLSPKYCGEGVPDYAAIPNPVALKFPFPVLGLTGTLPIDNTTGYPETEACLKNPFFEYYFSQQASSAFQSLYDNKDYIRDSFGLFWEKVAYNFKGYDHVIGYELINEPFAGDIYVDPELLIVPGKADQQNLVKMYDELAAKIRAYDTDHLIWYEPVTNDAVLLSVGFAQPPGGAAYRNQSVFSYHVYCGATNASGDPWSPFFCDVQDQAAMNMFVREGTRLGGGLMMTEWGALGNTPGAVSQVHAITGMADDSLQSWAYWQFKDFQDVTTASVGPIESFYDAQGNLQFDKVKAMSRTYAQAIAGVPQVMRFNPKTSEFQFQFAANLSATAPTIIYLNQKYYYPKGFNVEIRPQTPSIQWKQTEPNRIQITFDSTITAGYEIAVKITAV